MKSEKAKILLLAANPKDTTPLQLDEEARAIDKALQMAQLRDRIELASHWAVRIEDVVELLLRHRPTFIHFSGHGSAAGGILLESAAGNSTEVAQRAFADMLQAARATAKCVFLNACYSESQARAMADFIPAVIALSGQIQDEISVMFARTFYLAIGAGETIETAFLLSVAEMNMATGTEVHNVHLFGDAASLGFHLEAIEQQTNHGTTITNSTVKGMVQTNYGNVTMTFNDESG